ncbi:KAP family NTPase [Flavobacterium sp. N502536]|uniref:KAP family P-loop NTPase fold protein n=1 Tax=Flavobacterium sp. N502536 TaxID=2986837 RepID=UPI00222297D7|nr:KAP family NTPase [Flavobacterium sp. N502536]
MNQDFSADRPISKQIEDKFQRFEFAKRVATTINNRKNEDCIVIGLYGAWGEGKTSLLNFIESELLKNENILCVKFNPWRYTDENALLNQFFQKLADTLDSNLKTKKEKAGEVLKKYGKLINLELPVVGNIGETLANTGNILDSADIEELKSRLEEILKKTNSKIVIFIDDIDRLDKIEIHSIFRLVKLTADFTNTTYILSFDEEMVSAAIGERFGQGDQRSGQNFLEKIIQVPLKIPSAQPESLKDFCFEIVDNAINSNNIKITEEEIRRFVYQFTTNVLVRLDTPRLAIRYGNTISFSMPLLYKEVNIVDLLLIEALKIFYSEYYLFVKTNSELFIASSNTVLGKDSIESRQQLLDNLGKEYTSSQKTGALRLIQELFPIRQDDTIFSSFDKNIIDTWFKNKNIVSPKYFNKYFSYSVMKGEISDIVFQNFMDETILLKPDEVTHALKTLIEQSTPDNVLYKFRSIEREIDWGKSKKISNSICDISDLFPSSQRNLFLSFGAPKSQAALFIYHLIRKHNNKEEQYQFSKELLSRKSKFDFAYDLYAWLKGEDNDKQEFFTDKEIIELENILLDKALEESKNNSIFQQFPDYAHDLFIIWIKKEKKGLNKYIKNILNKSPNALLDLIKIYVPTATSTAVKGPYKSDFSEDNYKYFISLFDKNYINKITNKIFSKNELDSEEVKWRRRHESKQDDINIIRQFKYWYKKDISSKDSNVNLL